MTEPKVLKSGDPCPSCDGDLRVDSRLAPGAVILRHSEGSMYPEAHAKFRNRVLDKAAKAGVVHTCTGCGYQARLPLAESGGKKGSKAA